MPRTGKNDRGAVSTVIGRKMPLFGRIDKAAFASAYRAGGVEARQLLIVVDRGTTVARGFGMEKAKSG